MPLKGIETTFFVAQLRASDLCNHFVSMATMVTMATRNSKLEIKLSNKVQRYSLIDRYKNKFPTKNISFKEFPRINLGQKVGRHFPITLPSYIQR